MPAANFNAFKEDLKRAYSEEEMKCDDEMGWCYFDSHCDVVSANMPNLTFTFSTTDLGEVTYIIPSSSFLIKEEQILDGDLSCHVGVWSQSVSM